MAGAYCKFCDHRCFVDRVMPPDATWMPGQSVHLATCARGKAFDKERTGYDSTDAINPVTQPRATALAVRVVAATKAGDTARAKRSQRELDDLLDLGDPEPTAAEQAERDADDMAEMYPRDREDGEGLGLHRPSYGD